MIILDEHVPGALITGRARTARHHHSVAQQLLADRTQQLRGNVNLQSSHYSPAPRSLKYYLYLRHGRLIVLDQPGVLLNLLLTVGQLLHLVDDNQTFRDLNPLDGN